MTKLRKSSKSVVFWYKVQGSGFSVFFVFLCRNNTMAIPGFFRQTKPRGFSYVPRYYDPQKEDWDQKRRVRSPEQIEESVERKAKSEEHGAQSTEHRAQGGEKNPYRSKIMRGSMKNYFPRTSDRMQKQSMIRFVVILIILAFMIYIYLRY
jgi:hypothetical protein